MKSYQPGISVVVYKRVARKNAIARVAQADRNIDLTPFLAEGTQVQVTKDIRQPCGAFSVTLSDRIDRQTAARIGTDDTIYAALEPMDYIEIRMARSPQRYAGGKLPLVMRGFISDVRRTRSIGPDGKPRDGITISGQDYGKVLQDIVLFFREDYKSAMDYLSGFNLFVKYGIDVDMMSPERWMNLLVSRIINPFVAGMQRATGRSDVMPQFLDPDISVTEGTVSSVAGMQSFQGTLWELIERWADKPWNEVFVEDRDAAPVIVYRPAPLLDASANPKPVLPGAKRPSMGVRLTDADIVEEMFHRDDRNVANFFWTDAPVATVATGVNLNIVNLAALNGPTVRNNPNCDPRLYGLRQMTAVSNMFETGARRHPATVQGEEARPSIDSSVAWLERKREQLKVMNQDNVVFESGQMLVKGDERLKPGRYLDIRRGALGFSGYVTSVTHTFAPYQAFRTVLQMERCTGFLQRQRLSGKPYLEEAGKGLYP